METANAGREWSEMDIIDLRQCIKTGDSAAQTAGFADRLRLRPHPHRHNRQPQD